MEFNIWLNNFCDNIDWRSIKEFNGNFINKYFKYIDSNSQEILGKIIKRNGKNNFQVIIYNIYQDLNLFELDAQINFGPATNKEFCIKSALKYIDYFNSIENIYLKIPEPEFIKEFSKIIYKNSNFYLKN